jgi:hypothetical protein
VTEAMWWRCRCHDTLLNECPNRDLIRSALTSADRQWLHRRTDLREDAPPPQRVDVLGWTQHGAIVIGNEPGWIPETEPVYVRMDELVLEGWS